MQVDIQKIMPTLLLSVLSVVFTLESGHLSAAIKTIPNHNNKPQLAAGKTYHLVKSGDTLYAIGLKSGHGYQNLALWNRITPPYLIIVGQKLKLAPPATKKLSLPTHHKIVVIKTSDNARQHYPAPSEKKSDSNEKKINYFN